MQQAGGQVVRAQQVVQVLVQLLEALGVDPVPRPEAFRRAKANSGVGLEEQLYLLLANIMRRAGVIPSGAVSEHRRLVAVGLWQTGYQAGWVERRGRGEERSGEEASSREMLLALGWLLSTGSLERLLTLRTGELDPTILTTHIPDLGDFQTSQGAQLDPPSLRRLQWLIGCLRFQRRSLLSVQEERTRLLHTLLSSSSSSSSSYSVSSSVLRKECVRVQELCNVLVRYLSWKQQEKAFWAWMDSVVDCHLKEAESVALTPRRPSDGRRVVCPHGNQGAERLDDMMLRLPTAQNRENGGEHERLETPPSSPLLLQAYRARLQAKSPARHPGQRVCFGAGRPGEVQACEASASLLHRHNRLLEGRDDHRRANRTQLQEMIGRLEALVLIPH